MTEKKWSDGLSFVSNPGTVSHKVGDTEMLFAPSSVGVMLRLKGLVGPIAKCLADIFDDRKNDTGSASRSIKQEGVESSEVVVEAASETVVKFRSEQRQKAIEELVQSFTDPANMKAMGEVVIDSLRYHWKDAGVPKPSAEELMREVPAENLVQMMVGVAKANKGVFGPLTARAEAATPKIKQAVEDRIREAGASLGS